MRNVTLAPGLDYELAVGAYTNQLQPGETTSLELCSSLGFPPVEVGIVIDGIAVAPMIGGQVGHVDFGPPFTYTASSTQVVYDLNSGVAWNNAIIDLSIEENAMNPGYPSDTHAFSMALKNDEAYLAPNSFDTTSLLNDLNGGSGPAFTSTSTLSNCVTFVVVYQFTGGVFIQFDTDKVVGIVDCIVDASTLIGNQQSVNTALSRDSSLSQAVVENVMLVNGVQFEAGIIDGSVELIPHFEPAFVRGDCKGDLIVNIADGIWILNQLFGSGHSMDCYEACNANGDFVVDQSDAVFIFTYRFLEGVPPAVPFPACDVVGGVECDFGVCI